MSQKGTPEDHLPEEEEEDPHHVRRDHPQEVEEAVAVAEEAEEAGEERSRYPDTHPLSRPKNF